MNKYTRLAVLAALLVVVGVGSLSAHDTWIFPSALAIRPGDAITLNLTSGMAFPADDFSIAATRVVRAAVRIGGTTTPLGKPVAAALALQYQWRAAREGIATLVVDLAPRTLTLAPDKITEYLDDIDADSSTRRTWKQLAAQGHTWRESYVKHSKTFVRVGEPTADASWGTPSGLRLEIIPLRDPTTLHPGDTLRVRVLKDGRPIAGLSVGAIHESSPAVIFSRTNSSGETVVTLPKAGRWLLNGTQLRRTQRAGLAWESDFTTLTLGVRAR